MHRRLLLPEEGVCYQIAVAVRMGTVNNHWVVAVMMVGNANVVWEAVAAVMILAQYHSQLQVMEDCFEGMGQRWVGRSLVVVVVVGKCNFCNPVVALQLAAGQCFAHKEAEAHSDLRAAVAVAVAMKF